MEQPAVCVTPTNDKLVLSVPTSLLNSFSESPTSQAY